MLESWSVGRVAPEITALYKFLNVPATKKGRKYLSNS
jgi:hypothetical protein